MGFSGKDARPCPQLAGRVSSGSAEARKEPAADGEAAGPRWMRGKPVVRVDLIIVFWGTGQATACNLQGPVCRYCRFAFSSSLAARIGLGLWSAAVGYLVYSD